MKKIRVAVVDDSALIRALLTEIINKQADMEVAGSAADPIQARELIRTINPDVITLDIEMPKMDGLDFLEKIMRLRPMPVIMISTLTERGADVTLRALELGAIDFVAKPKGGVSGAMRELADAICDKIRIAAASKVSRLTTTPTGPTKSYALSSPAAVPAKPALEPARMARAATDKLIVIGASTGGTEAIREVLLPFPADSPPVVITQHMPPGFTASFAKRLDSLCQIRVKEAEHGERILPGHAYIAPGGQHFAISRNGGLYVAELSDTEPVNRHKPSVEVLFLSAAKHAGRNIIGVMLTGMGKDGATAMRVMKQAGAYNIAQNEASCVVFGMPKEAIAEGGVDEVLPLNKIGAHIVERMRAGAGVLSH